MKVLHICTSDSGGAGLCCLRINEALKKAGIESNVLVLSKKSSCNDVYEYGYFRLFVWKAVNKLIRLIRLKITDYNRVIYLSERKKTVLSLPTSIFDITSHHLVKEADVVHFHWIGNFVDIPSFTKKVNKPVVWTLHDENLFCGIRHYEDSTMKSELESRYYAVKLNSIKRLRKMGIVFLSKMMYDKFQNHEMIKGRKMIIINNSVDYAKFKPADRKESRKMLGIDENSIVFIFVAASINDERKGLDLFSKTLQRMNIPNAVIVAVGNNDEGIQRSNVISVGAKYTTQELCLAYSCGDYFVMPSKKEAFAQTPLEAMACGLPVVTFPVSGTEELVNDNNGVICDDFTSESLEKGIEIAMSKNYSSGYIRQNIIDNFSPEVMAKKYLKFYDDIMSKY